VTNPIGLGVFQRWSTEHENLQKFPSALSFILIAKLPMTATQQQLKALVYVCLVSKIAVGTRLLLYCSRFEESSSSRMHEGGEKKAWEKELLQSPCDNVSYPVLRMNNEHSRRGLQKCMQIKALSGNARWRRRRR